jgi:phosphoglycolate phosphatase
MPSFAAVLFDLDGTLVNTLPDILAALNRVMAEEGRRDVTVDEGRRFVGGGARTLVVKALAATGARDGDATPDDALVDLCYGRFLADYLAHATVLSRPYAGVVETLEKLRDAGTALGICTNKPHAVTLRVLEDLGLAAFFRDAVLGGDALAVRKPDARHLAAVAERAGAALAGCAMVGDSETDVATARAAGVPVVAVSFGYTALAPFALGADALIDHFAELPATLDRLGRR